MIPEQEVSFFFDSDALIQILLTNPEQILPNLRSEFGVALFIMNEVEIEVRSNRKFGQIVKPQLEKALKSKSLRLLSSSDLEKPDPGTTNSVSLSDIREVGRDYSLYVGTGEAYSHAAGLLLNSPVVSNDFNVSAI